MKSFIEPGNMLPFYSAINNGYITINKEKIYNIRYELEDAYGNVTKYQFEIAGKKTKRSASKKRFIIYGLERE
ncbi:MAG: hypothetical protein ACLVKO_03375 [Dysgonomonas sp.]